MADLKTLAAALIERHGATDAGRRVGCSRQMLAAVAAGQRKPSEKLARAIEAAAAEPAPSKAAPRRAKPIADGPVIPELRESIRRIDEALLDPDLRGTARASLLRARVDALHRLALLQNEGDVTASAIRRSRAWQEDILPVIHRILAKHPEAARDWAAAFGPLTVRE